MNDRWRRQPPVPGHREGESGDYRQRRINGRIGLLEKVFLSLLVLLIAGLSGYTLTKVSGDATFAKDGVIQHEVRIDHVEDTQKKLLTGQKDIIKLLFIPPADRKQSDLNQH